MVDHDRHKGAVHAQLFGRGGVDGRHQVELGQVDILHNLDGELAGHHLGDPVHAAGRRYGDLPERPLYGESAPQGVRVGITVK